MKKKIKPKAVPFTPITSDEEILNFIHSLTGKKKEDTIIGEHFGNTFATGCLNMVEMQDEII